VKESKVTEQYDKLKLHSRFRVTFITPGNKTFIKLLELVVEPANKIAFVAGESILPHTHSSFYRSGISSLKILQEPIRSTSLAVAVRPSFPFFDVINQMLSKLAAGGILSYWQDLTINPKSFKMKIEEIGPQILTLEHLMIGFQICLAALTFGVIAFGLEIGVKFISKTKYFAINKLMNVETVQKSKKKPETKLKSRKREAPKFKKQARINPIHDLQQIQKKLKKIPNDKIIRDAQKSSQH
jgi:hypothetical protein